MKVVLTRRAKTGLVEIFNFIAQDSPASALALSKMLRARAKELEHSYAAFPVLGRYGSEQVRRRTVRGYLILYVVRDQKVVVLSIIEGSRDYLGWLKELPTP